MGKYLILSPADEAGNRVVINVAVGEPPEIDDGQTAVVRSGDEWIGWTRDAAGVFSAPPPAVNPYAGLL